MRLWLMLLFLCCVGSAAYAAQKTMLREYVAAVKPDGSVVLSNSGNAVFANILFPDDKRAEAWLAEHLLQQEIQFAAVGEDRYGRTQIMSDAAQKMLRDGTAVFYAGAADVPEEWKAAEATARLAKTGVWSDGELLLTTENAAQHKGAFHVIEGRVTRIYAAKSATYLNFGDDWHYDFSITIPGKTRRSMKTMLQQLKAGNAVRVRGFIYEENGAMIRLTKADNLDLLP